jgi:hypothetical protein
MQEEEVETLNIEVIGVDCLNFKDVYSIRMPKMLYEKYRRNVCLI